jgi:hypothetical protein
MLKRNADDVPLAGLTARALVPAAIAAWIAYVGADFLTHAVVLAPWWRSTESYWLPPATLFARIPFAYVGFALYSLSLVWLMMRLLGPRPARGAAFRVGSTAGVIVGFISGLTAYSVFPMPASALLVWPLSVTVASIAAAAAGQWTLAADRPWRRVLRVLLVTLGVFVAGVVLQNTFFPPNVTR